MTDFPDLQHALVDAARRRHDRRAWARRLGPLVPVTAAVAVAAAAAFFLIGRPADDERSAAPNASRALARWYPVFRTPAGERDRLPLSGEALERFAVGPGGAQLDVTNTRLAAEEGSQRVYLVAARMLGAEAICAALFRDGEETSTVCGEVDGPRRVVGTVPADDGEPPTVFGAVPSKVDTLTVVTSRGSYSSLPTQTNGVLMATERELPLYVMWGNTLAQEQSATLPLGTEDGPWPASDECPRLQPLPANADRAARRVVRTMARNSYLESLAIKVGPVMAQRGLGAPCGPAVAARTLSVPVAMRMDRSRRLDSMRYATVLVGQIDGRIAPYTSLGR